MIGEKKDIFLVLEYLYPHRKDKDKYISVEELHSELSENLFDDDFNNFKLLLNEKLESDLPRVGNSYQINRRGLKIYAELLEKIDSEEGKWILSKIQLMQPRQLKLHTKSQ